MNEKVAGFGRIKAGQDPLTGQGIAILTGATTTDLDEKFMVEHEFTDWDKKVLERDDASRCASQRPRVDGHIAVQPATTSGCTTSYVAPPAGVQIWR